MDEKEKILFLIDYSNEIIKSQYTIHQWNNGRIRLLIGINGALSAGTSFYLNHAKENDTAFQILLISSILMNVLSFLICIRFIIPITNSKIGNEDNIRTSIVINNRKNALKYMEDFQKGSIEDFLKWNTKQIYGMSKNNWKAYRYIKTAAFMTGLAAMLLFAAAAEEQYHIWINK